MEVLKINPRNFKKIIEVASKAIEEGKVLICPTDTVYGLLCDAENKKAVTKLFKIKNRPMGKPIPIFVRNIEMAKNFAFIDTWQEKILNKLWPGKVTAILKRKDKLPKILFGKKKTIGLRIPDYKFINILFKKLNIPLTGTSANISGKPASTKIKEVINQFKNKNNQPDLILDAGNLKPSSPSTVIDLTGKRIKILRK
jgi:L-threonylcarbamoyladenylate synthase